MLWHFVIYLNQWIVHMKKFYLNATLSYLIKEYDILFYVSPEGVEIEDNGVRETNAEYRMAIDKKIKSTYTNA